MSQAAHSFVIQMRLLRRARERTSSNSSCIGQQQLQQQQLAAESSLVEAFFDAEAELERGALCRDEIASNANGRETGTSP